MWYGKLKKYKDIDRFSNVIEAGIDPDDPSRLMEVWDEDYFPRKQEIILELGCGWGEYTVNLASLYPDKNFIGLDIKGARMWHGAREARAKELSNVLFVRIWAERIGDFFPANTISEIWITFPDPHRKNSSKSISKRFTSVTYLSLFKKILTENGVVHLKTDSEELVNFTKSEIEKVSGKICVELEDIYSDDSADNRLREIQTRYEKRFMGSQAIRYLQFLF
jgi:tRNA (guanine-N7-)-methyltransferase